MAPRGALGRRLVHRHWGRWTGSCPAQVGLSDGGESLVKESGHPPTAEVREHGPEKEPEAVAQKQDQGALKEAQKRSATSELNKKRKLRKSKSQDVPSKLVKLEELVSQLSPEQELDALRVLRDAFSSNLKELKRHDFNKAITACAKTARWAEALQLLWDREDVDVISFNATLSACERASQWHFALHLLTLFDAKNDELEAIAEQADIISYNTSMSACEKGHQWSLALRLYEELQEKALRPDHITYSVALNACQQWTEALELLKRLEEVATSTTDGQTKRSFGAALGVMEKAAQWRSAVALLQRMSELTIGATSQSVALTVSAAERADSWWEALQLFEHFDPNLRLNGHSFTVALRAAEKGRQWSKAVWLLQRMQVARVEPSQHSLSTVLQICWKAKRWREVLKICEDTNYLPTQISDIQALLSSCEQSGRWEFALGLLSIPQLRSIMTQHQMLHLAVSALAGHWEMALSLLNEAAEPDVHAYNALLEAVPHPLKLWILESQLLPSLSPSSSQLHFRRLPVRLGPAGTRRAVRWWLHRWVEPVLRERRKSYKCSISWERRSSGVESQLGALQSGVMQMLKHERLWASEEKGQIELDLTRRDLKTLRCLERAARKSHGPNPGERSEASLGAPDVELDILLGGGLGRLSHRTIVIPWELETLEAKRQELSKGLQVNPALRESCKEIAWASLNKQQARRGFQWMLECLGGHQFRHFSLSAEKVRSNKARAPQGEDEQDAGWDFIISNGERDKENLKQMRWIHRHIQKEGSPIHGWNEKLVQRALDCLANDGCLAKLSDRYDLTIQAIQPEILTILEDLLPHLRGHSLSAPEFDFFRGIFFDKATPAIFDDGEIGNETIKKKKAFSDVGDSETILKERWTAAKFVMHQLRIFVDNQYNPEGQEGDVDGVFSAEVSHESFMKLVRPAVGYIANADAMAILKRAAFIVFAEKYIYFRPPTEKHVKVQRVFWTNSDSKDILLPVCKPTLKNWKNGGPQPDTYSGRLNG
ncbi:unnamed protein product [Durusdinium trenchii]|uniref:Pentatricopeptide repeat-containing protein, chloroplastic n=1 Tax=Durusdinium trenchii TaxID=1381693 RepID=A0ABP0NI13_9DINO